MVKINVSSKEIAHLWVNQTQPYAKANSQSFEEDKFYSYRAEIGAIRYTPSGYKIIILNTCSYSVTTSRHQSQLRFACNHLISFSYANRRLKPSEVSGKYLYENYLDLAKEYELNASRARLNNKINHLEKSQYYLSEANRVNKLFELSLETQDCDKFDSLLNELNIKYEEESKLKQAKELINLEAARKKASDNFIAWLNGSCISFPNS